MTERTGLQQITDRRQAASGAARAVRNVPVPKHPRAYVEQPISGAPATEPVADSQTTPATEPEEAVSRPVARKPVKDKPTRGWAEAPEDVAAAPKRSRVRQTPGPSPLRWCSRQILLERVALRQDGLCAQRVPERQLLDPPLATGGPRHARVRAWL